MSELYLHIGLPKTGSTAIQEFLWLNRDRLEDAGWRYPSFLRGKNHLELVVLAAKEDWLLHRRFARVSTAEELTQWRTRVEEEIAAQTTDGSNWVMSSEHLASYLTSPAVIETLRSHLEHFDSIRPVMWVRPQDQVAVASHSTWVRDGNPSRFDMASHVKNALRYDYHRMVLRWDRVFGEESVEVRLYPGSTLIDELAQSLGLGDVGGWDHPDPANVSLTNVEVELLRQMNERVPRWSDGGPRSNHGDFRDLVRGSGRGERLRASDSDRRRILEQFHAENQWILQRAVNSAGREDFFEPPAGDDPGNIDIEPDADAALDLAAVLWRKAGQLRQRSDRKNAPSE